MASTTQLKSLISALLLFKYVYWESIKNWVNFLLVVLVEIILGI